MLDPARLSLGNNPAGRAVGNGGGVEKRPMSKPRPLPPPSREPPSLTRTAFFHARWRRPALCAVLDIGPPPDARNRRQKKPCCTSPARTDASKLHASCWQCPPSATPADGIARGDFPGVVSRMKCSRTIGGCYGALLLGAALWSQNLACGDNSPTRRRRQPLASAGPASSSTSREPPIAVGGSMPGELPMRRAIHLCHCDLGWAVQLLGELAPFARRLQRSLPRVVEGE